MSHSFIDPKNDYYNVNDDSDTTQKKIDPVAQLKWLNTPQVYGGWGLFNNQPAQMFAQDEEEQQQKPDEEKLMQGKAEDEELQMKEKPTEKQVSSGTQTSIPNDVRGKMESSFGTDFSGVNIHQNSDQASNIGALAYTQGNDVHFAPGQYNPGSQKGQELLGHELTHVVQQRQGRVKPTKQGKGLPVNDNPALEKEADVMGAKAAQGKMADVAGIGSGVQRKEGKPYIMSDPKNNDRAWNVASNYGILTNGEPDADKIYKVNPGLTYKNFKDVMPRKIYLPSEFDYSKFSDVKYEMPSGGKEDAKTSNNKDDLEVAEENLNSIKNFIIALHPFYIESIMSVKNLIDLDGKNFGDFLYNRIMSELFESFAVIPGIGTYLSETSKICWDTYNLNDTNTKKTNIILKFDDIISDVRVVFAKTLKYLGEKKIELDANNSETIETFASLEMPLNIDGNYLELSQNYEKRIWQDVLPVTWNHMYSSEPTFHTDIDWITERNSSSENDYYTYKKGKGRETIFSSYKDGFLVTNHWYGDGRKKIPNKIWNRLHVDLKIEKNELFNTSLWQLPYKSYDDGVSQTKPSFRAFMH